MKKIILILFFLLPTVIVLIWKYQIINWIGTSFLGSIVFTLLITGYLHFLLPQIITKEKNWIKLEYIWIILGLLSVGTIAHENKQNMFMENMNIAETNIKYNIKLLIQLLEENRHYVPFDFNPELHSKEEFLIIQNKHDSLLKWIEPIYDDCAIFYYDIFEDSKYAKIIIDSSFLSASNYFQEFNLYKSTINFTNNINKYVAERDSLLVLTNKNDFLRFRNSVGLFLLLIALGIRLSIVTHKLVTFNKKQ